MFTLYIADTKISRKEVQSVQNRVMLWPRRTCVQWEQIAPELQDREEKFQPFLSFDHHFTTLSGLNECEV